MTKFQKDALSDPNCKGMEPELLSGIEIGWKGLCSEQDTEQISGLEQFTEIGADAIKPPHVLSSMMFIVTDTSDDFTPEVIAHAVDSLIGFGDVAMTEVAERGMEALMQQDQKLYLASRLYDGLKRAEETSLSSETLAKLKELTDFIRDRHKSSWVECVILEEEEQKQLLADLANFQELTTQLVEKYV